jgi:hypothetical protein
LRFPKWQDSPMSDRKLRLVAQNSALLPQPKDDAFGQVNRGQMNRGQVNCGQVNFVDQPGSPASAEEHLRLIKAFSLIGDNRRRTWLIDLVEHFASLESVTR